MLTNTYLSQRRPKGRRLELLTDAPPEGIHGPAGGPEERMALWPHVKSLPPRQRAVIVLRYYEDLSEEEIANTLGRSSRKCEIHCTPRPQGAASRARLGRH